MELREAIKTRRSVRKYLDRPVPREVLEPILNDALWAPSNANKQQWQVIAVAGEQREGLVEVVQNCQKYIRLKLEEDFPDKPHIVESILKYFQDFGGAPVLILVYIPRSKEPDPQAATEYEHLAYVFERRTNTESAAALAYNITLLAHEAGLATCWMTGPTYVDQKVNQYLGLEGQELICFLALGYSDQTPKAPPRKGQPISYVGF